MSEVSSGRIDLLLMKAERIEAMARELREDYNEQRDSIRTLDGLNALLAVILNEKTDEDEDSP